MKNIPQLFEYVKCKIDFVNFLEVYIGCTIKKMGGDRFSCKCPFSDHKDSKASFNVNYKEEDGVWLYNCFGCNSGGTIIDFCKKYYGLETSMESLELLANKYNLDEEKTLNFKPRKRTNWKKKLELAHILTASQCRKLLEKDYNKHSVWIADYYKQLNKALDGNDIQSVENIGFKALKRMKNV